MSDPRDEGLVFQAYVQQSDWDGIIGGMPKDGVIEDGGEGVVRIIHPSGVVAVKATRVELDWLRIDGRPGMVKVFVDRKEVKHGRLN
jgi:hypothetical protein